MSVSMLPRLMPSISRPLRWDIFCNVIDNFGDIGVCWRLARQLADEHGISVRLWVDELAAFQYICPAIDPHLAVQTVQDIEVRHWRNNFPSIVPGDVVIEAFACRLPEQFEYAMASRIPKPVWINLDYLSAEAWVSSYHKLPSPHPKLPLTKYFFFPGFLDSTGGLLRERGLGERLRGFCASTGRKAFFWQQIGVSPPPENCLAVSLFAYENPAISDLLKLWSEDDAPVYCLAPMTRTLPIIESFAGKTLQVGDTVRSGNLEIRMLPFVAQADYDLLLWSCDINFVRGEDSFVRAQWAAKPMVWQIYPQDDEAHRAKLEAFLDLYCANLSTRTAAAVQDLHLAWNSLSEPRSVTPDLWRRWIAALTEIRQHATHWTNSLKKQEDLCSSLVRFCRSKL